MEYKSYKPLYAFGAILDLSSPLRIFLTLSNNCEPFLLTLPGGRVEESQNPLDVIEEHVRKYLPNMEIDWHKNELIYPPRVNSQMPIALPVIQSTLKGAWYTHIEDIEKKYGKTIDSDIFIGYVQGCFNKINNGKMIRQRHEDVAWADIGQLFDSDTLSRTYPRNKNRNVEFGGITRRVIQKILADGMHESPDGRRVFDNPILDFSGVSKT